MQTCILYSVSMSVPEMFFLPLDPLLSLCGLKNGWMKKFSGCKQGSSNLWPQRTPPWPTSVPLFVNLHNGAESPKPQTIHLSLFSLCGRIESGSLTGWGLTGWTESCVVGWGVLFTLVMLPPLSTRPERGVWGMGRACGAVRGQGNVG